MISFQWNGTNAKILLVAGGADEAWPSEYSVHVIQEFVKSESEIIL